MKSPNLVSVKNLEPHIVQASREIRIDVALLAYLNGENMSKVEELVAHGTVFGFSSCLSAPLNRKLDEISSESL